MNETHEKLEQAGGTGPTVAVTPKKRTPNNVCPHCRSERVLLMSRRFFFFWRMPRKWVCVATSCPSNK